MVVADADLLNTERLGDEAAGNLDAVLAELAMRWSAADSANHRLIHRRMAMEQAKNRPATRPPESRRNPPFPRKPINSHENPLYPVVCWVTNIGCSAGG